MFVSCAASLIESLCPELKAGHFAVKLSIEIGKFLATRIVNLLQCATELPGNKEISIIYHAKGSTMVFESQMTSQFAITFVDNLKVVNNVNDYISNKLSNFGSSSNVENGCFSIKNNGYTMSPRFGNQNSVYHFYTYNMLRNIVINPEYRFCGTCGKKVELTVDNIEYITCERCLSDIDRTSTFCPCCGIKLFKLDLNKK